MLGARRRMEFQCAKKNVQRAKGISVSIYPLALARPGNVEDVDLVLANKLCNQTCSAFRGNFCSIDQLMRSFLFDTEANGLLRSAAQLIEVNYHRAIRVLHILQGALGEAPFLQLIHGITIRNSPKLIESPRRTPTAAFDSVFQCGIERRAINPCLSAGNNFQ